MNTSLCTLLKSRLAQAAGLLAVIAIIAVSSAWSGQNGGRIKLEGAWVAQVDNGIRGLVTYAPSDPSGQSAVLRAQMVWPPEVLAMMGLDAVTDEIGEEVVTGRSTTAYTAIWYGLAGGRVALIVLDKTTSRYVSPTERILVHVGSAYLPTADADNDGYPDPGTLPMMTFTNTTIGKRLIH